MNIVKKDTRWMTSVALMAAIVILLANTPLGMIQLPIIKATPSLLSFAFSPFMSTTGIVGAVKAVWISVGCRVLIGVVSGWLWILLKKIRMNRYAALAVTGFVGSMTNTVTVMGSIFVLLMNEYASARNVVGAKEVFGLIMVTVTSSGIPEAIAAMILVAVIGSALLYAMSKMPEYGRRQIREHKA